MIEQIIKNNVIFAIIIRSDYKSDGIEFFTPPSFPQQLGYMKREKGYVIGAHKHSENKSIITKSFETLVIRSGKVKVIIYDEDDEYFDEIVVSGGDIIMLSGCGHGFEMLEESEIVEIKQGPFKGDNYTVCIEADSIVRVNNEI